jgi:UDP:flavonoid glycosyltransferase YjiC (YdhE family)
MIPFANEPTPEALRAAVRTVLDRPAYRMRASQMASEFARIDTRSGDSLDHQRGRCPP